MAIAVYRTALPYIRTSLAIFSLVGKRFHASLLIAMRNIPAPVIQLKLQSGSCGKKQSATVIVIKDAAACALVSGRWRLA